MNAFHKVLHSYLNHLVRGWDMQVGSSDSLGLFYIAGVMTWSVGAETTVAAVINTRCQRNFWYSPDRVQAF